MAINKTNFANIFINAKDNTKNALTSAGSNMGKLGLTIAGVVATIVATVKAFESLKNASQMLDFNNIDVGLESAIKFSNALELSGFSAEQTLTSFQNLSEKVAEGINDESLQQTFKNLGISVEELKNSSIDDIFSKAYDTVSKIEDKTLALAEMKKIFGEEGVTIFNNAQDERAKRIIERTSKVTEELALTTRESNRLFSNFTEIEQMIKNDFLTSIGPILPIFNAILETVIFLKDEFLNVKDATDKALNKEKMKEYGELALKVGLTIADGFLRAWETLKILGNGILNSINLIALLGLEMEKAFTFDDSKISKLNSQIALVSQQLVESSEDIGKSGNIIFNPEINFNKELVNNLTEKFNNALDEGLKDVEKKGKNNKARVGINLDLNANKDALNLVLEQYKIYNKKIKGELDLQEKWNDFLYSQNKITVEEYYDKKSELSKSNHALEIELINKEIESKKELAKISNDNEKKKALLDITNLQNELNLKLLQQKLIEEELNNSKSKEAMDKKIRILSIEKEMISLTINQKQLESERYGLEISGNKDLVSLKNVYLDLMRKELELLEEKKAKGLGSDDIDLQILTMKNNIENLNNTIDPLKEKMRDSLSSGLSTFFVDFVSDVKNAEDHIKNFVKTIAKSMLNVMAQNWGKQLASTLMPDLKTSSSSSSGGFFDIIKGIGSALIGRQSGGDVIAGVPYLMGEKGPEIVVPGKNGTVINTSQTQKVLSGIGGGGINVTMPIYTNDAQSFNYSRNQILNTVNFALMQSQRNA